MNNDTEKTGRIVKGLGGLYEILIEGPDGRERLACRAKGALHRGEEKLAVGDEVVVRVGEQADDLVISSLLPRKNLLIRPPISNLDLLFIVLAAKKPSPVLETVDKMTAIAVRYSITPVIVVTKSDLGEKEAETYAAIYRKAGFPVFVTSSERGEGIPPLLAFLDQRLSGGRTAAFAGASGVGKSTLMNALFPQLSLATSEISKKIERGKHTTRHVELFPLSDSPDTGYLADTPGFSLLDFEHFDFFPLADLLPAFPDISLYTGKCRYADCTHTKEGREECAVARAAEEGSLAPSRLSSYRSLYATLKAKEQKYD